MFYNHIAQLAIFCFYIFYILKDAKNYNGNGDKANEKIITG